MNTIFKIYYQVWTILGIGSLILLGKIWEKISLPLRYLVLPIIGILFIGNLTYFLTATPINLQMFSIDDQGLDGLKYMYSKDLAQMADISAIDWLSEVKGQPNIVESVRDPNGGNSYNRIGRISAATGLPTILGWYAPNHEGGWRNGDPEVGERAQDVDRIYLSNNLEETKSLLRQYNIKYVYLGALERQAYPQSNFEKFEKIGKLVFEKSPSQIFEVSQ